MTRRRVLFHMIPIAIGLLFIAGALANSSGAYAEQAGAHGLFETLASLGTGFSYQGELNDSNGPVSDSCDFQFSLWDAASGGTQLGTTQTESGVNVSAGLFSALLNGDGGFGENAFNGEARWLTVSVRCPGGSGDYTTLSPRQELPSVPFALFAQSVGAHDHFGSFWSGSGDSGLGVRNTAVSGSVSALSGNTDSTNGSGVVGVANAASGRAKGVLGVSHSTSGSGVRGDATATSGFTYGVLGISESPDGTGVHGIGHATSGAAFGVLGESRSAMGTGVLGEVDSPTGFTAGVRGTSESTSGTGVSGTARAASGNTAGVRGNSESPTGIGVEGSASATNGINYGIYGWTNSPDGFAGYFNGNVHVDGTLTKSAGSFRIDHPLDPENKYLSHSFVESPDMMNIYNGNVTLDAAGVAWVHLPDWFEALNKDFRYQLTSIGAPGPNLYVAEEIADNQFKIAGGEAGMKVSWQVTGIRHDPYAENHPILVEQEKPVNERGAYSNPTE